MSVTPVHIEMTTAGSSGRRQILVTNEAKVALPVEIGIQRMAMDEEGNRKLSKAGDEFLIFPPQAVIAPGGTQVFRLQWVGEPLIGQSESFIISVGQVPVKLPEGKSALQVVMSFGVIVNVAPPQGVGSLRIASTGVTTDRSGKRQPTITVENPTKVHALLPQSTVRLTSGGWSRTFEGVELDEKLGIGLVQPGRKRKFVLPVELPPAVASVQATIDYKPKR